VLLLQKMDVRVQVIHKAGKVFIHSVHNRSFLSLESGGGIGEDFGLLVGFTFGGNQEFIVLVELMDQIFILQVLFLDWVHIDLVFVVLERKDILPGVFGYLLKALLLPGFLPNLLQILCAGVQIEGIHSLVVDFVHVLCSGLVLKDHPQMKDYEVADEVCFQGIDDRKDDVGDKEVCRKLQAEQAEKVSKSPKGKDKQIADKEQKEEIVL